MDRYANVGAGKKSPGIFARAKPSHHERPKKSVLTRACVRGAEVGHVSTAELNKTYPSRGRARTENARAGGCRSGDQSNTCPLFPASGLTGRFNLLLGGFLLFFYAELLSILLVLGLVLPTVVLYDAMIGLFRGGVVRR